MKLWGGRFKGEADADFARFNAIYSESFPSDPPARATVQVAALNAGARIELQMIAVKP